MSRGSMNDREFVTGKEAKRSDSFYSGHCILFILFCINGDKKQLRSGR